MSTIQTRKGPRPLFRRWGFLALIAGVVSLVGPVLAQQESVTISLDDRGEREALRFESLEEGRWGAENAGHRFRAEVTAREMKLEPAQGAAADWSWTLTFERMGRGTALFPCPDTFECASTAEKLRFHAPGLRGWVENRLDGLAHGWTLEAPLPMFGKAEELVIELRSAGLTPSLSATGERIHLNDGEGERTLDYSTLLVWDQHHKVLPSWFEVEGDRIRIHIDDREATYPIEIDPVVSTDEADFEITLMEDTKFGLSIAGGAGLADDDGDGAADGLALLVGAPLVDNGMLAEAGRVFLYQWTQVESVESPLWSWSFEGVAANANLGTALALSLIHI